MVQKVVYMLLATTTISYRYGIQMLLITERLAMMQMILYEDFEKVSLDDILNARKDSDCGQRVICEIYFNDVSKDERQNYTQRQTKGKIVNDQKNRLVPIKREGG